MMKGMSEDFVVTELVFCWLRRQNLRPLRAGDAYDTTQRSTFRSCLYTAHDVIFVAKSYFLVPYDLTGIFRF